MPLVWPSTASSSSSTSSSSSSRCRAFGRRDLRGGKWSGRAWGVHYGGIMAGAHLSVTEGMEQCLLPPPPPRAGRGRVEGKNQVALWSKGQRKQHNSHPYQLATRGLRQHMGTKDCGPIMSRTPCTSLTRHRDMASPNLRGGNLRDSEIIFAWVADW